jgi:hypothetical protein
MDPLERAYKELKEAIERKVSKDAKRRNKPQQIEAPRVYKVVPRGMEVQERGYGNL